jgi:N-carbamoylputrescine amidase
MASKVRIGLIQAASTHPGDTHLATIYGHSYVCDPRGQMVAVASRDKDELLVADIDLDQIQEVRNVWQFYRDRRPESYGGIVAP